MFKTKHDTDHARPLTGSPRGWLIFGPITGQDIVAGQSRRFRHGGANIINSKFDETRRCTSPKCFFGHYFIAGHLLGPTSL
jgi:hypothetical protein